MLMLKAILDIEHLAILECSWGKKTSSHKCAKMSIYVEKTILRHWWGICMSWCGSTSRNVGKIGLSGHNTYKNGSDMQTVLRLWSHFILKMPFYATVWDSDLLRKWSMWQDRVLMGLWQDKVHTMHWFIIIARSWCVEKSLNYCHNL